MFQWLFYNIVMHLLSFDWPFEMFSCFILGKSIVSCPQASNHMKEARDQGHRDELVVTTVLNTFNDYLVCMFSWWGCKLYGDANLCENI